MGELALISVMQRPKQRVMTPFHGLQAEIGRQGADGDWRWQLMLVGRLLACLAVAVRKAQIGLGTVHVHRHGIGTGHASLGDRGDLSDYDSQFFLPGCAMTGSKQTVRTIPTSPPEPRAVFRSTVVFDPTVRPGS